MTDQISQVSQYLQQHAERNVEDLKDFLRIPSISAQPAHNADVARAAEFVREQLARCGCQAELVPTAGHPIVFAETPHVAGAPTALVYGHYDVQPPDPLGEWISPPFEPDIRDGHIYARGATDDKGQMLTHVKSIEAWMKTHGTAPVNVKFLIEGEEEVGSNNLDLFLEAQLDRCACDIAVISDTAQYGPGRPAITYGLRGIVACEITLTGPRQDLHSGVFGGAIRNPANALAAIIAALHDDQGQVRIPGFYDDVIPLTDAERQAFAALPFDEFRFLDETGSPAPAGEAGFTTLERRWARPTCDVNGMVSGYTGPGPKTIIPARASAKISCRLVPDQDPNQILKQLEHFIQSRCPEGVSLEFASWHGCEGALVDTESPYLQAAANAVEQGFGVRPVLIREGGSIPVVSTFKQRLGVDTLLLGWGQNTDNLHSPNERFSLDAFHRGALASAWLWQELRELADS